MKYSSQLKSGTIVDDSVDDNTQNIDEGNCNAAIGEDTVLDITKECPDFELHEGNILFRGPATGV